MNRPSFLLAPVVALLAVAPEPACVTIPATAGAPILATHVQDWRDEVIYQVITDRFADGDVNNDYAIQTGNLARYQGGDWLGIQEHLDYLQALGVTTLWISPVIVNVDTDAGVDGYHGYWADDLTQPNKYMGDLPSLRSMVATAHTLGMKVVLDIVCNHMGQVFFYDMNLNGQPDDYIEGNGTTSPITQINEFDPDWNPLGVQAFSSNGPDGRAPMIFLHDPTIDREPPKPGILGTAAAYHGFGRILDFTKPDQVVLGDFTGGLKDIATEIPEVRATLVDSYARWVESVDFDGFRIDTIKHVEYGFWQTFAPAVRNRLAAEGKKNFLLFGEAFDGDDVLLGSYTQPGMLDSVFYFSQHYTVFRNVFENAHLGPSQQGGTNQIQTLWAAQPTNYGTTPQKGGVVGLDAQGGIVGVPPTKLLVNFIDNHDVDRFLYDAAGDVPALKNALALLYTEEGIPDLYYGTEQNFHGGNDPANREVLWNTNFDTTGDTFTYIAKLARIRRTYAALRRGDTHVVWSTADVGTEEDAGIFAFERTGGDAGSSYALVVLNANEAQASSTANGTYVMQTTLPPGTTLVDVLNAGLPTYQTDANGQLDIALPPMTAPASNPVQGGPTGYPARILVPQAQANSSGR
jgi:alpha-amylase